MTPLPNVPTVVRVQFQWTVGTQTQVFSHFYAQYNATTPPTGLQLNTFATLMQTNYGTDLKSLARPDVILTHVFAEDLSTDATPMGVWAGSLAGTRTSGAIPAETAVLLNFMISRRYRGGKPRMYLPFGNNIDVAAPQSWTPAFVTAVNTGWTAFHGHLVGAVIGGGSIADQVNVSYWANHALRPVPFIDGILSWSTNAIPASQRRRMGRSA